MTKAQTPRALLAAINLVGVYMEIVKLQRKQKSSFWQMNHEEQESSRHITKWIIRNITIKTQGSHR